MSGQREQSADEAADGLANELAGMHISPFLGILPDDTFMEEYQKQKGTRTKELLAKTMDEIERLFGDNLDDGGKLMVGSFGRGYRTDVLRDLAVPLHQLWHAGPENITRAANLIADGSKDPLWRLPIGDSGLLDAFIMIAGSQDADDELMVQVLRLIGNSCADTDENRARVVAKHGMGSIIAQLKRHQLVTYAIPVLYNICYDYEPAQKQASEAGLNGALIDVAKSDSLDQYRPFMGYALHLLDMIASQPGEIERARPDTVQVLVKLSISTHYPLSISDFCPAISAACKYLSSPTLMATTTQKEPLFALLSLFEISFGFPEQIPDDSDEEDLEKELTQIRIKLLTALSDLSDTPEFADLCKQSSAIEARLRKWFSSPHPQLQSCAAIMLGNLARSDAACLAFMHKSKIHLPLIKMLKTASATQTIFSTIGFLKNLALPAPNKTELGKEGLIEYLPRLWAMDSMPQIQYSAISLARQLLIGNADNVARIVAPLSKDVHSPASEKSRLSVLISLFSRSDAEPVRMEISRLLTTVCRVLAVQSDDKAVLARREDFFRKHADIGAPLSFMVRQKKWPAVRREGWFILAILARMDESVGIVADILADPEVFAGLVEVLTGKAVRGEEVKALPSPSEQTAELLGELVVANSEGEQQVAAPKVGMDGEQMKRIDRENALVLVSEVVRRKGGEMDRMRKGAFEELLRDGGSRFLSEK